jgi:hypothetical protein
VCVCTDELHLKESANVITNLKSGEGGWQTGDSGNSCNWSQRQLREEPQRMKSRGSLL